MTTTRHTYSLDGILSIVDTLKDFNCDFEVHKSAYTTEVLHGPHKDVFAMNDMDNSFFNIAQKLKKYYKDNPELIAKASGLLGSRPEYYHNARNLPNKAYNVICYDINSAYLNALLNFEMINRELYRKIGNQPKHIRLKVLGMLARTKVMLKYEAGELTGADLFEADTKPIFLFAVKTIDRLMEDIAQMAGDSFLFYWVDGIYLNSDRLSPETAREIELYILEQGYEMTCDHLQHFKGGRLVDNPRFIQFEYEKQGKKKAFQFSDKNWMLENKMLLDYALAERERKYEKGGDIF